MDVYFPEISVDGALVELKNKASMGPKMGNEAL